MSILMERAAEGHKKSMITLYEGNKEKLFAFCKIILNDEEKAGLVTAEVINEAWDRLAEKGITSEVKFGQFLLANAARKCGSLAGIKDAKTSKSATRQVINKVYTGDVASGMEQLRAALKELDPYQRYVYLLVNAGNVSVKEVGQFIKQKDSVAKNHYGAAVSALADVLEQKGGKLQVEYGKSLLEQAMKNTKVPGSVDVSCKAKIKERAKNPFADKRIVALIVACVVCVVSVSALGAATYLEDKRKTEKEAALNKAAEEAGITLLDDVWTYYADITVEGYGKITIQLDEESAPLTAANFATLATNGFYDGLTFHRIIDGFMMQGGDPNGNGTGGADNTIHGEFTDNGFENNLSHTRGAISMARAKDYDSASSQFFIMQEDRTSLDGQYAVFGYVTEGMEIVDAICEAAKPTDDNGTIPAEEQPVITSIFIRYK